MQIPSTMRVCASWPGLFAFGPWGWQSRAEPPPSMNLFGRSRSLSQTPPPPLPPKRPESLEQVGPTVEELEEGDMYEVPPCESQVQKVAPAKRQENADGTYLDHASARHCSEPLPLLPAKFLSKCSLVPGTDVGQVEEMPRGLASGKAPDKTWPKPPPAPSPRRLSLPGSGLSPPPVPACPAAPRDSSLTSWDNKEGPPEEELYLECELIPAACRVPPPRPPKLPRPKIALPVVRHGPAETSPGASSPALAWPGGSGSPVEDPGMQDQAWYAGSCDRHTAESLLHGVNKDSAFMVRQSSGQGWKQPFTLAVLYQGHVYNVPIRYLEGSRRYVLGKEGKRHEELFDSVPSIIQHYSQRPLVLIEGSSSARAHTCLLFPVKP